jgi:hypothetical protein
VQIPPLWRPSSLPLSNTFCTIASLKTLKPRMDEIEIMGHTASK